jgi:hypothetical protein
VRDEIDFEEAGAGIIPLGEGADRNLVSKDGTGAGDCRAARRVVGAGGRQQPGEGGAAGLSHELGDGRGDRELSASQKAVQELGHEGMEPMRADPATGLPQDLGHGGDLRAVRAWPTTRAGCCPGPPRTAEQPDGRFPVNAGHGHDLIQALPFLGSRGLPIALALDRGVLPKTGSRHGSLLDWIGNRDF